MVPSVGYNQEWLRGGGPYGHVHEGLAVTGGGWVGVGHTVPENSKTGQVMVRRVDSEGATMWTRLVGDSQKASSVGYSVAQVSTVQV